MPHESTIGQKYFDEMFAGNEDPWRLATSDYETAKHDHTLSVLKPVYRSGFEVGCANGVLTRRLASRCERLLAVDISPNALSLAARRCATVENIRFDHMNFPSQGPDETFDLIVLSEVAYYWDDGDLTSAASRLQAIAAPGCQIILVHWTGETDYPQTADDAVEKLSNAMKGRIDPLVSDRRAKYRLDLWQSQ